MYDMERDRIPESYRPLSAWAYFGLQLLYAVPLLGWVCLICRAIGSRNINERNCARSFSCVYIVVIVLVIVLALMGVSVFTLSGGRNM